MSEALISAHNLSKSYLLRRPHLLAPPRSLLAVNNVNLHIERGETLGLVGESGSGKSTLGHCLIRLQDPSGGRVIFCDQDITDMRGTKLRSLRRSVQIIFQDPEASLNPCLQIGAALEEPLLVHRLCDSRKDRRDRVRELLELVGLKAEHANLYPHQFSGGQRQRIGIARALAVQPKFVVCDEPVSALDVAIQAQIINLLLDLQQKQELTYLFISHDLRVVGHLAQRVAVLQNGQILEQSPTQELFSSPQHEYTRSLLASLNE